MLSQEQLDDPVLRKLIRSVPAGDCLFQQGDHANSMFLILEGTLALMHRGPRTERRVGTVGAGEMVGEKAIVTEAPYTHTYSAVAESEVVMLELDRLSIKAVQKKIPDLPLRVLKRVTERLDTANELISILMLKDEPERLIQYLTHFCRHHCQKSLSGKAISITVEQLAEAANLDPIFVGNCVRLLVSQMILVTTNDGFLIQNEDLLLSFLPDLQERVA